jgi:ubiquinol-cytochrome c reductase cytochrome c1 subunit
MSASEYDQFARDLTAFLTYVGEPAILKRERIGIWVMLFLSLLTLLSYFMYQEYWRDIKK